MEISKTHISIAALVAVCAVAFFTPPHLTDKVVDVLLFSQPGRKCYQEYKSSLKDPYSAYLVSSRILKRSDLIGTKKYIDPVLVEFPEAIEIVIAAKNSFGAYGQNTFQCPSENGVIDEVYLAGWRVDH